MIKTYDTLAYYEENAEAYCQKTLHINLKNIYDRFLQLVPEHGYILDFGCGSGRDSKYFLEQGHKVKAVDGSKAMCKLAANYIGQEVQNLKFTELNDVDTYDAIWACCSVMHVEKAHLGEVLKKMARALKPSGIIYLSFKTGTDYEIKEGKYYNYSSAEGLEKVLSSVDEGLELIDSFENPNLLGSDGPYRQYTWGNYFIRKN